MSNSKLPYGLQRALARLGLVKKPAPPAVPTVAGVLHLQTLEAAVRQALGRERKVAAASTKPQTEGGALYLAALEAAANLLGELSKAAAAGDARS